MKWALVGFGLLIFIAACSSETVVCNEPYMLKGTECCLDNNSDNICDADMPAQAECPELDCSLCAAEVVTRNVTNTVTKFICTSSGAVVENPDDCSKAAGNAFDEYEPVVTNENGTVINLFTTRTACRDGHNAIEFHWNLGSTAQASEIQIKEAPEDEWETVYTYDESAVDKFIYGVFCNNYCTSATDFYLDPDKAYLVRGRFNYNRLYEEYQYSNEHLVDATSEGEYKKKLC